MIKQTKKKPQGLRGPAVPAKGMRPMKPKKGPC